MRDVKSEPGSIRAERATVTRRRIEAAARSCFAEHGYAATTLREIAADAGVAVQTVYAIYGSKANILGALRLSVVADPAADSAWGAALTAPDVTTAIEAFARSIRLRWEHGHDIVAINADAARSDPRVRAGVDAAIGVRRAGIGEVALALVAADPALGPVRDVTAILEALTVTEIYATLTGPYGWTPDSYEAWLARALLDALRAPRG